MFFQVKHVNVKTWQINCGIKGNLKDTKQVLTLKQSLVAAIKSCLHSSFGAVQQNVDIDAMEK